MPRIEKRYGLSTAWLALACFGLGPASTVTAEVTLDDLSPHLRVSASLRARAELYNYFDAGGATTNDYAFGATMARAGVAWKSDAFDLLVEGQNSALLGLPDHAVASAPAGALGLGATYFINNRRQNDASVFLKQGFATVKTLGIDGAYVKGGRFEFSDGSEVSAGEPTLDWLKSMRLSQRLIGPFGFSHVGRSFDGATAGWTHDPFNVTAMASHPTQGGFDLAAQKEISDIDLAYLAINLTRPEFAKMSDARLFYIYYADGRDLLKTDNRPMAARTADHRHIEIHSEGADYVQVLPTAVGPFDALAWGIVQQGEWGLLTHRAWAWDLEAGWQPKLLPWGAWLRIGFGRTSGDDDPADHEHQTFFQILPTARIYSLSAFYNLQNDQDGFASILLRPLPELVWRTDFHDIRLTSGNDLFYSGSGATEAHRAVGFGYSGRPAGGREDLFRVVETSLNYDWNPHFGVGVYYGHLFGGSVIRSILKGDQADFGFVEATIKI